MYIWLLRVKLPTAYDTHVRVCMYPVIEIRTVSYPYRVFSISTREIRCTEILRYVYVDLNVYLSIQDL